MNNLHIVKKGFSKVDEEGGYTEFWLLKGDNLEAEAVQDHLMDRAGCWLNRSYSQPGGPFRSVASVRINNSRTKALVTQFNGYDI